MRLWKSWSRTANAMASGGKREGAGRPEKSDDDKRMPMTVYLPEKKQVDLGFEAALNGLSVGELIELWLGMYRRP